MSQDAELRAIETRLLLEGIFARYGYDLREYTQDSLSRRIQLALARSGAPHLGELLHRTLSSPDAFRSLLDDLTVQVSEMFRDPPFYRVFRERVIPILRTYPQLKIWHAGCASGEEVYTMAILLEEEGLYERSVIYATDISQRALSQAQEGIYPESVLDTFVKNYQASGGMAQFTDNFSKAYGRIAIHQKLKRNIVFFRHNLAADYAFGEMNVTFCRNVMIYFGQRLREQVIHLLAKGLCRGGFLGLGANERLSAKHEELFTEFATAERIYRLRGADR